jgi:transcriptional regulator with XRE-family HTH domain
MKGIAKFIRRERERRKMPLSSFADLCGVSKSVLHRIEQGEGFNSDNLIWMRKVLKLDLNKIIDEIREEEKYVDLNQFI